MKRVNIAIDLMSGDHGIGVSLPAVLKHKHESNDSGINYLVVGHKERFYDMKSAHPRITELEFIHAEDIITMDEEPSRAIRKRESSMRKMLQLIKEGRADGGVSAGNTGALMMLSHLMIRPITGINRTAICAAFPTLTGKTWVLDLGANVTCEPENLLQFAIMGSALVNSVEKIKSPAVSLLNVGSESHKGNPLVQESAKLLEGANLNYSGFIEGDMIFNNPVDVVVTDGFTGNTVLKACEGMARYLIQETKNEVQKNLQNKILSILALPFLFKMKNKYDPSNFNGACFLGFKKTVVKSHGGSNTAGFANAIKIAVNQIRTQLPDQIQSGMGMHK